MAEQFESKNEKNFAKALLKGVSVQSTFNDGDNLPYGYFNPESEGSVTWMCGYDADGKITSVFSCQTADVKERNCAYLGTKEEAMKIRDELKSHGWQPLKPPEVEFTYKDMSTKGNPEKKLNRKQRRAVEKKINNAMKSNPFTQK